MIGSPLLPWLWGGSAAPVVIPPDPVSVVTVTREVPAFTNPSVIRIANLALQRVGVTQPIASLEEQSKEARVIRQAWDHLRDLTLQEYAWGFAVTYGALPLLDGRRTPWRYTYRVPGDCLHPLRIAIQAHAQSARDRIPFELQSDASGPVLVADVPDVVLVYLARLIDPLDWPVWFHELLAWRVAAEIAMPLTVNLGIQQSVERGLQQARLMAAQRSASASQAPVQDAPSSFVTARDGYTGDHRLGTDAWR